MNPFRTILAALLAATVLATSLPAFAPAAVVTRDVAKSPAAVRDYWTKERMREAEPVPVDPDAATAPAPGPAEAPAAPSYVAPAGPGDAGPAALERGAASSGLARGAGAASLIANPAATGTRAHGKVFFTVKGGSAPDDYVCSGTAVNSRNQSLVWTAGHCIYDWEDQGGKSVNFQFVPAYSGKGKPFGEWPASELATTSQWKRDGNLRFDIGTAVVDRNPGGRTLQSIVGGRGIGFDQPRDQNYKLFGYPVEGIYADSLDEYRCKSALRGSDVPPGTGPNTLRASCDMTGGSSGGGWIARGLLLSNTSYGYGTSPYLYGPYFSQTAKKLYKRSSR
ncbi:MAG: hypothetical protein U0R51_00030 [Solirubrobacterales bacterium]